MARTASDLQQIKLAITEMGLATKVDLKGFATKDGLIGLATKDDLRAFATKEDLEHLADRIEMRFATKDDFERMESRLLAAMGLVERDAFSRLDDHERRISRLEKRGTTA
jgi:hypothetical protein